MKAQELIGQRNKLVANGRTIVDKADKEKRRMTSEERETLRKMDADITALTTQISDEATALQEDADLRSSFESRERELSESRGRKTGTSTPTGTDEAPSLRDRDLAFRAWVAGRQATDEMRAAASRLGVRHDLNYIDMVVRRSVDADGREVREFLPAVCDVHGNIKELRANPEKRALSSGTTTAGGDSIPTAMMQRYTEVMKWYARIDQLADVLNTENGQNLPWPTVTDTANTGRVIGEGTTATTSTDPTFSKVTLGAFKVSSDAVVVPWELQMDSFIDLASWLGKALGTRVGRKRNSLHTAGAGTTEPKGLFTGAATGVTAAVTNAFTMDETITLEHSVDPAYRGLPGTGWMVHDTIAAYLRKLKDGIGRYLWEPSLQLGQPDRFRGYPVYINNDMDSALTTGKKLLGFGNVGQAFVVRNAGSTRFIRDESIFVKEHMTYFEALERCDSNVVDSTAFKILVLTGKDPGGVAVAAPPLLHMRVRAITSLAVNHGNAVSTYAFGEVFDLPDHEAEAHIAAGHVERIDVAPEPAPEAPVVETATTPRPKEEQAVRSPKRPSR
jgi:HK97 family phage major capsid protein